MPYLLIALLCQCADRPLSEESGGSSGSSGETGATDSTPTTTIDPSVPPTTDPPPTEPPTTDPPTTTPTTPTTITTDPTTTTFPTTDTDETSTTVDPSTSSSTTVDPSTTETTDTTTDDPVVFNPLALELADFDGDELLDLLTLGVDETLAIASRFERGNGDGTFAPFVDAGLLASASAFPTIGALDNTPGADVILDKAGPPLSISRWVGDGPFEPWMDVDVVNILLNTKVLDGDKDGDGDVYALWATEEPKKFGVTFVPNSDGNFFFSPVDTQVGTVSIVGIDPNGLLVGDLNGDGIADALLFQSTKLNSFLRVFGTPQGAFAQPKVLTPGVIPWVGDLADMDGDLDLDAVFLVQEPRSVVTLINDGAGNLVVGDTVPVPDGFKPFTLDIADLVGDDNLDVAVVDDSSAFVTVWTGKGGALDTMPTQTPLPSPAVRVVAGKIDGDDKDDLALATFAVGTVTVLLSP
jgi:hypothetical protein